MHQYEPQTFNLPDLKGLSAKQIEVHLGLYQGYVKHVNLLRNTIAAYEKTDDEGGKFAIAEMRRRLGFEFNGMRMHEYYFEGFENGAAEIDDKGALAKCVSEKYGDWNGFIEHFKKVGLGTRGIGWVILYYDPKGKTPHVAWVSDHELGQLAGLPIILAMDMWEHAYMVDYAPAEKKQYVETYLANTNWQVAENRFSKVA